MFVLLATPRPASSASPPRTDHPSAPVPAPLSGSVTGSSNLTSIIVRETAAASLIDGFCPSASVHVARPGIPVPRDPPPMLSIAVSLTIIVPVAFARAPTGANVITCVAEPPPPASAIVGSRRTPSTVMSV